jgi:hypothetical protein
MKLTPEQRAQLESDRVHGLRRTTIALTPEQEVDLQRDQELETSLRDEHLGSIRRIDELLEEDSFVGSIRRALDESAKSWEDHARDSGVAVDRIEQFFCGSSELSLSETDRLISALGLHLVPVAD